LRKVRRYDFTDISRFAADASVQTLDEEDVEEEEENQLRSTYTCAALVDTVRPSP
jgi:hypothetical protein